MPHSAFYTFLFYCSLFLTAHNLTACTESTSRADKTWQIINKNSLDGYFSHDGRYLLSSTLGIGAQLWDLKKQAPLYHWQHESPFSSEIYLTHISADNKLALTASQHSAALWQISNGQNLNLWRTKNNQIRAIRVSSQAQLVLLALDSGEVELISLKTGKRKRINIHKHSINSMDISNDGNIAITGANDYLAVLWHTSNGEIKQTFKHKKRVLTVRLSNKQALALSSDNKQSIIWRQHNGEVLSKLVSEDKDSNLSSARFSYDDNTLVTGGENRKINLWDTKTGQHLKQFNSATAINKKRNGALVYDSAFPVENIQDKIIFHSFTSSGMVEYWSYQPK